MLARSWETTALGMKSPSFRARLLGLKFWLCHFPALWTLCHRFLICQCFKYLFCSVGLLWQLKWVSTYNILRAAPGVSGLTAMEIGLDGWAASEGNRKRCQLELKRGCGSVILWFPWWNSAARRDKGRPSASDSVEGQGPRVASAAMTVEKWFDSGSGYRIGGLRMSELWWRSKRFSRCEGGGNETGEKVMVQERMSIKQSCFRAPTSKCIPHQ